MNHKIKGLTLIALGTFWLWITYNFDFIMARQTAFGIKAIICFIIGAVMLINGIRIYHRKPAGFVFKAEPNHCFYPKQDKSGLAKYRKPKNTFILLSLICIFLILRLAVLFSYLDGLYEQEELYRGTIAKEIISGPLINLWEYLDYKVEYFPGGVLTVGILAVPFFLLFGPTYIALKLVGLTFSLAAFITWYVFLDRFFNRKTAVIGGLLFIFCMPFYTKTSLITWGAHPEANLFTILSIFIFYKIFFEKPKNIENTPWVCKNNMNLFFLLGLVAGFGLWFVQTYLFTIIFLLTCWFIFDIKFFLRKKFLNVCCGFITGFAPAIYYQLFHKGSILNINGKPLLRDILHSNIHDLLPKIFALLFYDLPRSFLFSNSFNLKGEIFSYIYYFIFIAAFAYLIGKNRKSLSLLLRSALYPVSLKEIKITPEVIPKESLLLIYPLLFFFSYSLSGYSVSPAPWDNPQVWLDYIGYRYMIPVTPFIIAIISIFLGKIGKRKLIFYVILFLSLSLGIIGNVSMISIKNFGRFLKDKGYSYNILGDKIGLRIAEGLNKYIAPFNNLPENERIQFYEGLGAGISWRMKDETAPKIMDFFENNINAAYQPLLYKGWGTLFSPEDAQEFGKALYLAKYISKKYLPYFYEGFGRNMGFFDNVKDINTSIAFINTIEEQYRLFCYQGLGYTMGFELKIFPEYLSQLTKIIDEKYHRDVYRGIKAGMDER